MRKNQGKGGFSSTGKQVIVLPTDAKFYGSKAASPSFSSADLTLTSEILFRYEKLFLLVRIMNFAGRA